MRYDTEKFAQLLEEERKMLEQELVSIGIEIDPESGEWIPRPSSLAVDPADLNEVADAAEESEENEAILINLERRYKDIRRAQKKIEHGTFGVCEISGDPIEEDRLMANPAARTCKAHLDKESTLPE